jgi:hypothetical protein
VAFTVLAQQLGISDGGVRHRAWLPIDPKLLRITAVVLASVEPMVGLAMYKNMLKWGQP